MDWDRPRRGPAARKATRDPSGWKTADPNPIKTTLIKIVMKFGARANPSMPNILLARPSGKAYGLGNLSVYIPTNGCITDATIFKVKAIKPNCVKVSPNDFSKIGNIAGMTA